MHGALVSIVQIQLINMKMKKQPNVPKGSYHAFCREIYQIQPLKPNPTQNYYRNYRKGYPKTVQTQRTRKVDQFNTFQQYLSNINNNQTHKINKNISRSLAFNPKSMHSNRKHSQINSLNRQEQQYNESSFKKDKREGNKYIQRHYQYTEREINANKLTSDCRENRAKSTKNMLAAKSQLVGAFLPYFKVKIDSVQKVMKGTKIKLDDRKFKLKELLVQENKIVDRWFVGGM